MVVGRIGDDLRVDYTAQGHTVGLAQRMDQLAPADGIALSEHTPKPVEGFFALRSLGPVAVKGVREPVGVFVLEGVGSHRTRLDTSRARGLSRFVGRGAEMDALEAALERSLAGTGRVAAVVGEPGVGKSRLCAEVVERCRGRGLVVYEAHCPAHGKTIPYLPLLELLRNLFGITDQDGPREARQKIAGEPALLDDGFADDRARERISASGAGREWNMFLDGYQALCRAGMGDRERSLALAQRGVEQARANALDLARWAQGALRARVLRMVGGLQHQSEIEAQIAETLELIQRADAKGWLPFILLERAGLARLRGDADGMARDLAEARRLFAEMGVTGWDDYARSIEA